MKRRLAKLAVFLILGAIINVAVAWACAANRGDITEPERRNGMISAWVAAGLERYDVRNGTLLQGRFGRLDEPYKSTPEWFGEIVPPFGLEKVIATATDCLDDGDMGFMMQAFGWPLECMTASIRLHDWSDYARVSAGMRLKALEQPGAFETIPVLLPLRPIWPGFAINTVFYAAILWLLFAGPFVLRRLRGGPAHPPRPVPEVRLRPARHALRCDDMPRMRRTSRAW